MCTVTLISHHDGYRLACNRDELKSRPLAELPKILSAGSTRCIAPIDPAGGGTWIAVNEHGVVVTILNLNLREAPPLAPKSRGELVMRAIEGNSASDSIGLLRAVDPKDYRPFRLVVFSADGTGAVMRSSGQDLTTEYFAHEDLPFFMTSSGLGDHFVEGPRRELFNREFGLKAADQDVFHAHRWVDRPELSVNMDRADAATVSYTVVEVSSEGAVLRYHPGSPMADAETVVKHLGSSFESPGALM
ncbi:MAG: NRDE family protein [Planctomycetota bacterium]